MGVADNKTYKNTTHFRRMFPWTKEDAPSVNVEPQINSTIKENPYRANVEIEKGEIVYEPDLSALYKARGKKHYNGGIDVNLKPNSFIFSDDKSLSFTENDIELLELKKGGSWAKTKSTPAKILKKNIDPEHYNRLVTIMDDPDKDELSKNTAVLMLEKYIGTLGNIAFMQEKKKSFPDGLPDFSLGTAPMINAELEDEVMTQKQFAKYGGKVHNPYLEKAQRGDIFSPNEDFIMSRGTPEQQKLSPVGPRTRAKATANSQSKGNRSKGYSGIDEIPPPSVTETTTQPPTQSPCPPGFYFDVWSMDCKPRQIPPPSVDITTTLPPNPQDIPGPIVPNITGDSQKGVEFPWEFTPWQKVSQGYNALKYATAKRYMPYRGRFNATLTDPALVNPEQAVGDMRAGMNNQIASLRTLSPILSGAQSADAYGQYITRTPAVRSQYDNQNAQIINQNREGNRQAEMQEDQINLQNDMNYYKESVVGQQNFDNLKSFLGDQYMNNLLQDVQDNQSMAYKMAQLGPKPAYGFDWRTGNFSRNDKNILDVATDTKSDAYTTLAQQLMDKVKSGQTLTKPEVDFFKALSLGKIQFNPQTRLKKGGTFNPYK